jgi:hypothetical protein
MNRPVPPPLLRHRVFDRTEHLRNTAKGLLVENSVDPQTDDTVLGESVAHGFVGRIVGDLARRYQTISATPKDPAGTCTSNDFMMEALYQLSLFPKARRM